MKEKKKKDPKKKKRALIITGSILGVFALFVITVVMITIIGDKANIKRAESYDPVVIENQLVPEKDENGYWTFTTDRDLKIMQLTGIHLGGGWLSLKKDSQAINAVATMIQAEKPDLVIITGYMAFPVFFKAATFNNKLPAKEIAALMSISGSTGRSPSATTTPRLTATTPASRFPTSTATPASNTACSRKVPTMLTATATRS